MVGRGEKSLFCDPGSELWLRGGRGKKGEDNKWNRTKIHNVHQSYTVFIDMFMHVYKGSAWVGQGVRSNSTGYDTAVLPQYVHTHIKLKWNVPGYVRTYQVHIC